MTLWKILKVSVDFLGGNMRKDNLDKSGYERLKRSLGTENAPSEDFIAVLRADIDELLKSYFVYDDGMLKIETRLTDCGTEVTIKCLTKRRKPIKVL